MKIYFKVKLIGNTCMVNGEEIKEPIYYDESLPNKGDIIVVPVGHWKSLAEVVETKVDTPNHPVRKVITLNPLDLWNKELNEVYHSLKIEGVEITKLSIINQALRMNKWWVSTRSKPKGGTNV